MVELRVLVVVGTPVEPFLLRLFRGLADRGVQLILGSREPDPRVLSHPRVRWLRWPSGWKAAARHPLSSLQAAVSLRGRGVGGHGWDVLYFPWNLSAVEYLHLFDLGLPVVVSCRGAQVNVAPYDPARPRVGVGLRETFTRAAAVHCVSEAIQREAAKWGLPPGRSQVIRPGVDLGRFVPGRSAGEGGEFRVITVGSLGWRKGHEYSLLALRSLVEGGIDVHFDVVGEGRQRQRVEYTLRDLGLRGRVTLHGRLPEDRIARLLPTADAFLLASLSEGISNAVLEAMSCGLPVVTTDCGGMREVVDDGVHGLVVPVRDPAAIASALERLARDRDLRHTMGQAGRRRVEAELGLDRHVEAFHRLLKRAVAGNAP